MQPLVDALKSALLINVVLHADETPVAMVKPGHGKTLGTMYGATAPPPTRRRRRWSTTSPRPAGAHPKAFLAAWSGKLVCDDYAGYKALFHTGVTEVGCLAHARRKFHEL